MKRNTLDHPKMQKLGRLLKVPKKYVILLPNGIMERLWQFTAKRAPQGNIGKIDDEEIATACEWPFRKARVLIDALCGAGWIDRSEEHRLLIHDWHEHCDEGVKKYLRDHDLPFLTLEILQKNSSLETNLKNEMPFSKRMSLKTDEKRFPSPDWVDPALALALASSSSTDIREGYPAAAASVEQTGEAAAGTPPQKTGLPNAEPETEIAAVRIREDTHREFSVHAMELGMPAPDRAFATELRNRWPNLTAAEAARKYPRWPGQDATGLWKYKSNQECELELSRQTHARENPHLFRKPTEKELQNNRLMEYAREKDRRRAAGEL